MWCLITLFAITGLKLLFMLLKHWPWILGLSRGPRILMRYSFFFKKQCFRCLLTRNLFDLCWIKHLLLSASAMGQLLPNLTNNLLLSNYLATNRTHNLSSNTNCWIKRLPLNQKLLSHSPMCDNNCLIAKTQVCEQVIIKP